MSFDDIPEDAQPSFPCPDCEFGEIALNESFNAWECDECEFTQPNKEPV